MIKRLKYWYWREFKHEIHPEWIKRYVCDAIIAHSARAGIRKYQMAAMYAQGCSFEEVAKEFNVTRERVRQVMWRLYRDSERDIESNRSV